MIYRQERVVLTIIGITVLIALILFLGGIMNGMKIQARQYVESTGANIWISAEGSGGAFIGFSLLVPEYLAFLRHDKRLTADSISPLVFAQARPIIRRKAGKAIVVGYKRNKRGGLATQSKVECSPQANSRIIVHKTCHQRKLSLMKK